MKRFTETTKWRDPWFRKLSPTAKLLWLYLTDNCDPTGLLDPDLEAIAFDLGCKVEEKHLSELDNRVQRLDCGKIFIPKFIPFQYGSLSPGCPAHRAVIKLVTQRNLIPTEIGYSYPSDTLTLGYQYPTRQDKTSTRQEPDRKEGVQGEMYSAASRVALHYLNEKSGRRFRETSENLGFIHGRLSEPDVTIEGVRLMIDRQCSLWKDSNMAEFLRPETLFNKTKFDAYYAAKDQPINGAKLSPSDRNFGIAESPADKAKEVVEVLRRRELAEKMAQPELAPPPPSQDGH